MLAVGLDSNVRATRGFDGIRGINVPNAHSSDFALSGIAHSSPGTEEVHIRCKKTGRNARRSAAILGFTVIAVASLGLGIGGATAVFTLVNAVVLRTLPVPEPHQLFQAQSHAPGQDYGGPFSAPMFDQLRAEVAPRGVELFAATGPNGVNLQPAGEAIQGAGPRSSCRANISARTAAGAGRQSPRRRAPGRRHQRRLLAASPQRPARRDRPPPDHQRRHLHDRRHHEPAVLRETLTQVEPRLPDRRDHTAHRSHRARRHAGSHGRAADDDLRRARAAAREPGSLWNGVVRREPPRRGAGAAHGPRRESRHGARMVLREASRWSQSAGCSACRWPSSRRAACARCCSTSGRRTRSRSSLAGRCNWS